MKFLILFVSAFALTSAVYQPYGYHYPVVDHNGVPFDTPEVQIAKSQHLAAHAAAAHGLHYNPVVPSFAHAGYGHIYGGHQFQGIDAAGRPLDTPEVEAAKLKHFQAYHEAAIRNAAPQYHHYRKRRAAYFPYPQHVPVIGHNGVPVDTPEVQAARAEHLAAHAKENSALVPGHYNNYNGQYQQPNSYNNANAYHGNAYTSYPANSFSGHGNFNQAYHIPVIGPQGVPIDTPEVQAARASHLAAHSAIPTSHHYQPQHY